MRTISMLGGILTLGLVGCQDRYALDAYGTAGAPASSVHVAAADLIPASGSHVRGTVLFTSEAGGLRVTGKVTGLTPGKHGFHVHEKGDCSAPDASSAGDHFNPTGQAHGAPGSGHVGDLGNIIANDQGVANLSERIPHLSLSGTNSILGKAVIVHQNPDDLTSQPAGDAGQRIACGVIKLQGER